MSRVFREIRSRFVLSACAGVACAITALAIAGCSSNESSTVTPAITAAPTASPTVEATPLQPDPVQPLDAEPARPENGVVVVTAKERHFLHNNIRVHVGDSLTIRVTNSDVESHDLRIAGLDGQYNTEDDAVTEPAKIDPGQTGELNFSPASPGGYTFRCDFHPGSMGGQIIVEP